MDDKSQLKVDMSLDDIIKLNKREKRDEKKANFKQERGRGRGRGQLRGVGRGRGQLRGVGRGRGQLRGVGRGSRGKVTGRGRGVGGASRGTYNTSRGTYNASRGTYNTSRGAYNAAQGRGRGKTTAVQTANNRFSMRGTNQTTVPRRGRGRGRGVGQPTQMGLSTINRQAPLHTAKNLRGIGRGRGRGVRGGFQTRGKQIFTNSAKKQVGQQRSQELLTVKAQATLLREKETALKNLQQAKRNMLNINKAIQQTSRDGVVNQRRGINFNSNGAPVGRGRGRPKLLAGLMNKAVSSSMPNLASIPSRQMMNTSVTISNPRAANGNRRRQWRSQKPNIALQVDNASRASNNPVQKPSFVDQLKNLKPTEPTTYKFQKNMFAVPSTSISLNDRFSSETSLNTGTSSTTLDGRKVFL